MKPRLARRDDLSAAGFTLAEVLAALALLAILIPVVVEALSLAGRAGSVAQRKALAARIGERVLNEVVVAHSWGSGFQNGTEQAGPYEFNWTMQNNPWKQSGVTLDSVNVTAMHELSVDVSFDVRGREYHEVVTTLIDTTVQ